MKKIAVIIVLGFAVHLFGQPKVESNKKNFSTIGNMCKKEAKKSFKIFFRENKKKILLDLINQKPNIQSFTKLGDYFKERGFMLLMLSKYSKNKRKQEEQYLQDAQSNFYKAAEYYIESFDKTEKNNYERRENLLKKAEDTIEAAKICDEWYFEKYNLDGLTILDERFKVYNDIRNCRNSLNKFKK